MTPSARTVSATSASQFCMKAWGCKMVHLRRVLRRACSTAQCSWALVDCE